MTAPHIADQDPLAGYSPNWRSASRMGATSKAADDDPLADYTSDWRSGPTPLRLPPAVVMAEPPEEPRSTLALTETIAPAVERPRLRRTFGALGTTPRVASDVTTVGLPRPAEQLERYPTISATPEPGFLGRLGRSFVGRVREKYREKPAAPGALSAMPKAERKRLEIAEQQRIYGEAEGRTPDEIQRRTQEAINEFAGDESQWSNRIGEMLGEFVDPTMLVVGAGAERATMAALQTAAAKGVPLAGRLVELAKSPAGAGLVRRLVARATHGAATGGTINVAAQATATAGEQGRLPTPREAGEAFAVGTAAGPAMEVAGSLAAAPFRRRTLGPPRVEPTPAPKPEAPKLRQRVADAIYPEGAQERRTAQRAAETDALTGMGNRAAFDKAKTRAELEGTEFVVFDLNNLKAANDILGHEQGDQFLRQAATAMGRAAQEAKVPERVFRLGGDEFAMIVPEGSGHNVRDAVERIYGSRRVGDFDVSVSGSVGKTFTGADAGLQAAKQARKAGQNYRRIEAGDTPAPTNIVRMPVEQIVADPARFQFKALGAEGVSGELKGVTKFNERLAGVISAWRDPADGRVYVVNGHHRLELAKRLGQKDLNVQFIDAPTAEAARAEGAIINIAEGRGTAVDAAKVMRDMGATAEDLLQDRGVSLKGELARSGFALSRLAPDVFDQVATAKVPQNWGVAIGEMLDDAVLQREALTAAQGSGKRLTQAEVRELARQVRDAGTESLTQESLFGTEAERRGLFVQRAQLAAAIQKRLAGDKRLFGFVAKEGRAEDLSRAGGTRIDVEAARGIAEGSARARELFDRLYTRSGPIADIVNEGARRIAHGEKPAAVVADIYPGIGDAVGRELEAGLGVRPDPAERAVSPGARSVADEIAAAEGELGPVATSTDPAQAAMFSPARRADMDLFGEPVKPEPTGPEQGRLFGELEGTKLAQSERLKAQRATGAIQADEMALRRDELGAAPSPIEEAARKADDQIALLSPSVAPEYRAKLAASGAPTPSLRERAELRTLMEISRKLADAVGVPLRQGRFNAGLRKAMGVFFPQKEVTRVQRFDKLDTVAHEVGHFLSKKYLGNPTKRGASFRLPAEAVRELNQLGKDLYGTRKPAGGYGEEGIAEWVSFYVTEPATLAQKAPNFTAWMDQNVLAREPMLRASLTHVSSPNYVALLL